MRSVEELAIHIADGRVDWFRRIAPERCELLVRMMSNRTPNELNGHADSICGWLNTTYSMVEKTLEEWSVDDLSVTFHHPYQGNVYAVSRQWTIWRIMAHDIHHGGQLSELLSLEGIFPIELTELGGHLTEPPIVS